VSERFHKKGPKSAQALLLTAKIENLGRLPQERKSELQRRRAGVQKRTHRQKPAGKALTAADGM